MTSMLSSTALILLSNHFIECWILWLICDALYLLMYLQSDLFYSLYKSAFYIAFAGYSYYRWQEVTAEQGWLMKQNILYAHSGGITAALNATAAGVISASQKHKELFGDVYILTLDYMGLMKKNSIQPIN